MNQGKGGGTKAGAYLGGIRTVEDLRCRCRMNEETGCWHWGMAICDGAPTVHFVDQNGVRRKARGRRASLLISGRVIPKGHTAFAKAICKSDDCVNPEHSRSGTRDEAGAHIAKSGIWKNNPNKMAAIRELSKKKRKLTPEAANEIRLSDLTHKELSEAHGISRYAIWCIKQGRSYKQQGYGVFSLAA